MNMKIITATILLALNAHVSSIAHAEVNSITAKAQSVSLASNLTISKGRNKLEATHDLASGVKLHSLVYLNNTHETHNHLPVKGRNQNFISFQNELALYSSDQAGKHRLLDLVSK